jgi:membrane-bound lytic murein transglycosylase F
LGWLVFAASALVASAARAQDSSRAAATGMRAAIERTAAERARQRTTSRYDGYFKKYSKRYFGIGFDWRHFKAQGMAESELRATARRWVGARGIMQLMPSTFQEIQTRRPEFRAIDDPEWNIAAGIMHDRYLWNLWKAGGLETERTNFMFASYNAGEGTIRRACGVARAAQLDSTLWTNIEQVAPRVQRWRYHETLGYVRRIQDNYTHLSSTR